MQTATAGRLDKDEIKTTARGRWPEIFASQGIDAAMLDGKHHPCPKCQGRDRFRLIDADAGALRCNNCLTNCGDGFAALQWWLGCSFPDAVKIVASHLGIGPSHDQQIDVVAAVARAKRMPLDAFKQFGAAPFGTNGSSVARVPMYGPDGQQCSTFDITTNGKGLSAKGQPVGLFLPGRTPAAGETWLLVEGCKDAAALVGLGYLAAGLPTKELAVKFARLFRGANIIIVPDRDAAGSDGAQKTAARLFGVAASVRLATLPAEYKETDGADVRDVLGKNGGEQLVRQAITDAVDWKPNEGTASTQPTKRTGKLLSPKAIADIIASNERYARDAGGKLFRFAGGTYKAKAETHILASVKAVLNERDAGEQWSSRLAAEVVEYIRVDAPELWERPPLDRICVKNGLLRLRDKKLLPHSAEFLSPVQLPITFDPLACCPTIEKCVSQWFAPDSIALAYEIPAALMVPGWLIDKAILLLGGGGNGKSRYLAMVRNFIGKHNTSAMPLHKLESNTFASARLVGKLANICPDLPSEDLAGTSVFKSITGGDTIPAEHKFHESFEFDPYCRLVFSANHPPRSGDDSPGFFQRWLVIAFDQVFRGEREEIPADELDRRLAAESSGLLNKCLTAHERLTQQRGYSISESVRKACDEFHNATDPLAVWLDRKTVESPDALVVKDVLRAHFAQERDAAGKPAMTANAFGRRLKQLRPSVQEAQRNVSDRKQWCYVGIGLRE